MIEISPDQASTIAATIHQGFKEYRQDYAEITTAAKQRFENAEWSSGQAAGKERLNSYNTHVHTVMQAAPLLIRDPCMETGAEGGSHSFIVGWPAIKAAYTDLINNTLDVELAETFFNSVHREHTDDGAAVATEMFLQRSCAVARQSDREVIRTYQPVHGVVPMVKQMLEEFDFNLPWRNMDKDVGNILRSLAEERKEIGTGFDIVLEVVASPFYRNKGAYLIGRLSYQQQTWPVALPVLRTADGQLYIDTLICDEDEMSVMFSFTRSYFMVDNRQADILVAFLQSILPNKKRSELYASIGLHKHGKTEFYRGFLAHLAESCDQFVVAPGIKGMVMAVFTLPSYQTVFKVIKDRFAPPKKITRAEVKAKYHVVKTHDRVGRMADTQEFENFSFPKKRFDPSLLEELYAVCPSLIVEQDDNIIIKHLYTERHMTPLNMYIEDCSESELVNALDEYGNAIDQLAAANIFPGDMLLKNFGITRHGRVVFYDYDEISYLTDMNFRDIPEAQTPEQEMAAEPWYSVSPRDVFPEEFRHFLFGKRHIKQLFTKMHGNLFEASYWKSLQDKISGGEFPDVFPYRRKKRFSAD
ncbi:MAG: bifunctional isocitrate dehydrogenase kinase/phosphatase [Gammaproteobacteria bacterium]|nr:bifunctional isocitrate dehydrogenase kinase/phosphatase [Gammaproteobacteria bacterium]